jgi:hypothetical protein
MKIALLPMAILFSILGACAGVVEENFIASATLGQDGDRLLEDVLSMQASLECRVGSAPFPP